MRKIFLFLMISLFVLSSATVLAQGGLEKAGEVSGLSQTAVTKTGSVPAAIGLILGQAVLYLGIIFFLLIVYAGFLWMTASGNDSKVEKAKSILIAAVSGLVISVSAYAITNFVFGNILAVNPKGCTAEGQGAKYAACQDINSQNCVFEGQTGGYVPGLCEGVTNIQCCVVKK